MAKVSFDVFHILADISHAASILILLWAFTYNRSAEGVSLLTQLLYLVVFAARYIDLLWTSPTFSLWLFFFKLFFLITTVVTIYLMLRVFPRTKEKDAAQKMALYAAGISLVTAPFTMLIFNRQDEWSFHEFSVIFSLELESVCVLPQLLLLRQTSVPTVIDSYYLLTLGAYRFLYILSWIVRGASGKYVEPELYIFGAIQTLLYLDFAWVYYSRQRVKLRGGGIIDSDDMSKSFLIRRFIGTRSRNPADDEADEDGPLARQENGSTRFPGQGIGRHWGARGISVSADDTLEEHEANGATEIADPARFEDEADDEDDRGPPPPAKDERVKATTAHQSEPVESSAQQWSRD